MYGDLSRLLDPLPGQYSGVLAQQGRLLLDAELNEQHAIVLDYLRRLATDLIGPFAGPEHDAGFAVEPVIQDGKCHAVRLGRGHYYVYGLRCQAPPPHHPEHEEWPVGEHEAPFVVYLAVWEQSVSAVQAPELVDPAIGAAVPDTTRRAQVRWRPMAGRRLPWRDDDLTDLEPEAIIRAFHEYDADPRDRPVLAARAHSGGPPEPGPETAPTPWGYRGVENQLYRVEIFRGGDAREATFTWSRDNGSVEFGLDALTEPDGQGVRTATLRRVWYDTRQGLEVGDWVELVDDHWAPLGRPAPLLRVTGVQLATRQVTLQDTEHDRDFDPDLHPLLRRWDQRPGGPEGVPLHEAEGKWRELEDGVQIRFDGHRARYEHGDYWLIPARTATKHGVLWPRSRDGEPGPLALPPDGPARYLAPLALFRQLAGEPVDLRMLFGYRAGEHRAGPGPGHPAGHDDGPAPVTASVTGPYLVRSVSTLAPGAVFAVRDGTMIGRAGDAGIFLDHPGVSEHQAVFRFEGGALTITDLGSASGTEVNGQRLEAEVPATLSPGDTIQAGSAEVQLQVEEA